ncbi:MAG: hypothetical protein A7316_09620 [Candidatus Altiarchaeales archaeon WOR_SM1_86-2]|nr:MAG: hypothetical protein A7316_09620 [Candidatus Altiarchaeales archaeon WOR_SM1_86-2]
MEFKLKSINIQNFKSLKDTKIELADFNILVGANGSGKSNIVDVFSFLKHINQEGTINPFIRYGGYKNLVWKKNDLSIKGKKLVRKLKVCGKNCLKISCYSLQVCGFLGSLI